MDMRRVYEGRDIAEYYAKYKPIYKPALYETVVDYYESGKGPCCTYDLAVDVGCGSGQFTLPLAKYFNRVIGVDISKDMISHAPKNVDRVEFKEGVSEDLHFLPDASVDLVSAACAYHWFDHTKFNEELTRVLKPGGVLTVVTYSLTQPDDDLGQEAFQKYLALVQKYDIYDFNNAEELHNQMPFPFAGNQRSWNKDAADISYEISVSDFIGLLRSVHNYRLYCKENPNSDILEKLQARLEEIYRADNTMMKVTIHGALIVARKPV